MHDISSCDEKKFEELQVLSSKIAVIPLNRLRIGTGSRRSAPHGARRLSDTYN